MGQACKQAQEHETKSQLTCAAVGRSLKSCAMHSVRSCLRSVGHVVGIGRR